MARKIYYVRLNHLPLPLRDTAAADAYQGILDCRRRRRLEQRASASTKYNIALFIGPIADEEPADLVADLEQRGEDNQTRG